MGDDRQPKCGRTGKFIRFLRANQLNWQITTLLVSCNCCSDMGGDFSWVSVRTLLLAGTGSLYERERLNIA